MFIRQFTSVLHVCMHMCLHMLMSNCMYMSAPSSVHVFSFYFFMVGVALVLEWMYVCLA